MALKIINLAAGTVACAGLLIMVAGCGDKMGDITSSVKDAAKEGMDKARTTAGKVGDRVAGAAKGAATRVEERAGLAGVFELTAGGNHKTDACYAQLIVLGQERPSVLQLRSSKDAERESFPSVFVRAEVSAADFAALVGQSLEAQLFIKPSGDAPTLFTQDAPVQMTITSIQDGVLEGRISGGSLTGAAGGSPLPATGSFRAVTP